MLNCFSNAFLLPLLSWVMIFPFLSTDCNIVPLDKADLSSDVDLESDSLSFEYPPFISI